MTKKEFRSEIQKYRNEMLTCRNKKSFKKKWLEECQKECFIYKNWTIATNVGMYDLFNKNYYEIVREKMEQGLKIKDIRNVLEDFFMRTIKEMDNRMNRDKKFNFSDNEQLIYDFCYGCFIMAKVKKIKSSNDFGIMKTSNIPLKVIEIY